MAHTNSTTNYGLPQFITTDKPAWLTDVNTAYADIDLAMKNNADAAATAGNNAIQALSDASAASTTATGADAKATGAIASIADIFDPSSTYNVGDLVVYNNLLYICIVAVTTPAPWTGITNWSRTTFEDVVNAKQNMIDNALTTTSKNVVGAINENHLILSNIGIKSITRVASTVTTGTTGNIATGIINDGKHFIIAPYLAGSDFVAVPWVASSSNEWFITIRGSSSFDPVVSQSVAVRYWIVEMY